MSHFRQKLALSSVLLGLWLVGCNSEVTETPPATEQSQTETTASDTDSRKKVLTTFSVSADIAQNVAGDKLVVESITRIGAECTKPAERMGQVLIAKHPALLRSGIFRERSDDAVSRGKSQAAPTFLA